MSKKSKRKVILLIVVLAFAIMTVSTLIYATLYYNVLHAEYTGGMKSEHVVMIVCSIIGLLASLYFFDKIKRGERVLDSRTLEERLQNLAEYHLKKHCPTAEKLHSALKEILKQYGVSRVRSVFLSYDLLYIIKPGKWFGFTFNDDYRDNYIDVQLGELYHFGDVVPRLVIVGQYADMIRELNLTGKTNSRIPLLENAHKNIDDTVDIIKNTFEIVIANIDMDIICTDKERIKPYLIKELATFEMLKLLDKNAIEESCS